MKTVLLLSVLILSNFAMADCPVDASNAEAIQTALDNTTSCYEAVNIAENCAWGSSMDVGFTATAQKVCDTSRPALTPLQQSIYDGLVLECGEKYKNEQGTMYRSAAGFCALKVAETFASIFSPVGY